MGLISTLTSSSTTMGSLSSTTSSALAISVVITCSAIAVGALIFVLALTDVMSRGDYWNANSAATRRLQMVAAFFPRLNDSSNAHRGAALRIIYVPLIVTFCAFLVFTAARLF
jgi:hypothetical protein